MKSLVSSGVSNRYSCAEVESLTAECLQKCSKTFHVNLSGGETLRAARQICTNPREAYSWALIKKWADESVRICAISKGRGGRSLLRWEREPLPPHSSSTTAEKKGSPDSSLLLSRHTPHNKNNQQRAHHLLTSLYSLTSSTTSVVAVMPSWAVLLKVQLFVHRARQQHSKHS